jgi:hypothetical protein
MDKEARIKYLEEKLKECMEAFKEHIRAVDHARRMYHDCTLWYLDGLDDDIDAAEQVLWKLQEEVNNG